MKVRSYSNRYVGFLPDMNELWNGNIRIRNDFLIRM